jgi:uncharacterized protein (TIGR00266 family)
MQHQILCRPMASVVKLGLDEGESVTCEVGAMIAMTEGLSVETTSAMKGKAGGLLSGVKRMFAGENYFLNHFTAQQDSQILILGPTMQGDVIHHRLRGGTLLIQGSSWLASTPGVTIDASWQGLGKAFFSGEGAFWIRAQGQGDIFLSSFGAIYEVEVNGQYTVDTGHIVAFEDTMQFQIVKAGASLIGSLLGGEGLVCRFTGQGKLYCQSHNPTSFGQMLSPSLKPR